MESPSTRKAGGLVFRPLAGKTKARQRFDRCGCNRVHSTRFKTTNQSCRAALLCMEGAVLDGKKNRNVIHRVLMSTTQIHMVRHGEVFNPQKVLYGRLPRFRLSATGLQQARSAGRYLRSRPIRAVFSSPMLRARQTADAIMTFHKGLKPSRSKHLNEVCNPFEGRPGAEIDARHGDIYTGSAACFEQPGDVFQRVQRFLARIRKHHAAQQVVAVTHGDVITFTVLWAKGFPLTPINKARLQKSGYPVPYPAHASITTLIYRTDAADERPEVHYISV